MPTARRTVGTSTASRTRSGSVSPREKIWSASSIAVRPASVSARPRPAGFSRAAPRFCSSSRTWVDTVCTDSPSFSAARVSPPSLATTQK
jgi:hypothetical protein